MRQVLYMAHAVAPTAEEIAAARASKEFSDGPLSGDAARKAYEYAVSLVALRINLQRAMQWLSWLRKSFPETTFIAPWISSIIAGEDDSDPKQREAGLVDCCAVVERCDGIVLVGGRISSGMRREMEHGKAYSHMVIEYGDAQMFEVYDLTSLVPDGSTSVRPAESPAMTFAEWAEPFR